MKTWLVTLSAVALVALAIAAPIDYSVFSSGRFKGPYFIGADSVGISGETNVRVTVPRNGRKMTVKLMGTVNPSSSPTPISCTLRFDNRNGRGRVRSDAALLGFLGPVATKTARVRQKGRILTFRLATKPDAILGGSPFASDILFRFRLASDFVAFTGSGNILTGSTPQPVTFGVIAD